MSDALSPRDAALPLDMSVAARDARAFGEAAGKVSPAFRAAQPSIPWRAITRMRHRLIHGYAQMRLDLIWQVVEERLAPLIAALEPLVPDEGAPHT